MNSSVLKVAAAVTVVLALLLAIVGYRMSRQFAESSAQSAQKAAPNAAPQTLAVVALKPLAAYTPIARDAIALVPVAVAPPQFYSNLDDVAGKTPLVDIDAGAPVTPRYFKEGNVLARLVPPGFQALSIEINDVVAVGDFVRPGDVVDVLLFLRNGSGVDESQARVLLHEARVLAYEDRVIDRPEGLKDDPNAEARRRQRTAVLAVPVADATRVMLGASLGDLRLALHGQKLPEDVQAALANGEKAEAAAAVAPPLDPRNPDQVFTINELVSGSHAGTHGGGDKPKVEIYRGDKLETVYE